VTLQKVSLSRGRTSMDARNEGRLETLTSVSVGRRAERVSLQASRHGSAWVKDKTRRLGQPRAILCGHSICAKDLADAGA